MKTARFGLAALCAAVLSGCVARSQVASSPMPLIPEVAEVETDTAGSTAHQLVLMPKAKRKLDSYVQKYVLDEGVEFAFCVIGRVVSNIALVTDVKMPPQRRAPLNVYDTKWDKCPKHTFAWGHAHPINFPKELSETDIYYWMALPYNYTVLVHSVDQRGKVEVFARIFAK